MMTAPLASLGLTCPVLAAPMAGGPMSPALAVAAAQAEADAYGLRLEGTTPVEDDDAWSAKVDLLVSDPVPVVSFTFGLPDRSVITALKRAGTLIIQTVTSAAE